MTFWRLACEASDVNELRWHPLLREWVAVAAHRQDRPQMPADWCPFDPGSGKVPEHYDVHLYPNDFPAFRLENAPFEPDTDLYRSTGAQGTADVVLYHPDHNLAPSRLSQEHWRKVADLWTARTRELTALPEIEYVFVFENTGEAIGVTMPHPHGQIYGFPFLPPLVKRELEAAAAHPTCIFCEILRREEEDKVRLVAVNRSFAAFVPYWARWPAEVHIYARRHYGSLMDLQEPESMDLAGIIKTVRMKYDNLYGFPMPLMMILRQSPAKGRHPNFHFHVEFYPIQRSASKLKYLAGAESGAGTFLNDTVAEDKARELRETEPK
jgi:UDPglucose--hexose-1-phosphate uridylyltransferase